MTVHLCIGLEDFRNDLKDGVKEDLRWSPLLELYIWWHEQLKVCQFCHLCVIIDIYRIQDRAGFTLSRALFRKKCGALHLERQTLFFLGKKLATFYLFSHYRPCVRCQFSSKTGDLCSSRSLGNHPLFPAFKNLPLLLWGPFLWGPLFGRTCWTCLNPPLIQDLCVMWSGTGVIRVRHSTWMWNLLFVLQVRHFPGRAFSGPACSTPPITLLSSLLLLLLLLLLLYYQLVLQQLIDYNPLIDYWNNRTINRSYCFYRNNVVCQIFFWSCR